ncbi:hypothetical protein [Cupriavidus phytorum]|uniref:hypothetical protein n=1 Tax=Cupriavidus phytorum TaxID=3024399 RepID=UPI0011B4F5F6|nr:hypothetical protein [Cupriavidus alkaliphilus]
MPDQLPQLEDVRLWLSQCKQWAAELADLESWPADLRADILDRLRRAPAVSLQAQAEHFRVRTNEARAHLGIVPDVRRLERATPPAPTAPQPKWKREWQATRGIAKALPDTATPAKRRKRGTRKSLSDFPEDRARYERLVAGEANQPPKENHR